MVNANDIAGIYAGLTFGISNTFATIPGNLKIVLIYSFKKVYKLSDHSTRHHCTLFSRPSNKKSKNFN